MPRNEHYQSDILYITQPTRNILLALGVWPSISKEKSVYPKTHNLLLICISYILFSSDLIPGILYWVLEETTRIRLQIIPLLLYDLMSASSYGIFIFRYDQLRRCLKHIEEDWENVFSADARDIMLKSARTGKRLVTICGVFMYSGVITFRTILPLSQGKIVTDQNVTLRHFACPGYFFSLDVQVSPVYETVFVIQFLTGFITVSVVTGACGLTAIFVVHACGQLKILINLMRSLVQEQWREEREVDEKLAEIVEHQVRVRNFLRLVQHTLQEIYLMEILVNTIAICLLVYFMLVDWQNKNITTLCTYIVSVTNIVIHIFLFCYTGEQLSSQAEKVAIASCELEWYRLPDRNVRSVVLLMIVSNAPTKISAGKFMDLSLRTFGAVMKTAGAYFNMLRSVVE
ncbi:odorant receptor 4-like [Temnothorax nylanderi]|uniref:odorant receptor 4-like n=1 Tax=Temnothorax nylanderi TaxID=102681 RepID=UPI003A8A4002